jgi:serine/threonine protein kinase
VILGNTVQDYLISAAIFLAALFIGELVVKFSKEAVRKWISRPKTYSYGMVVTPIFSLIALLVPIAAIVISKRHLYIDYKISLWIDKILLISTHIIVLFVLIRFFYGIIESVVSGYVERIEQERPKDLSEHKKSVELIRQQTRAMVSGLIIIIAVLAILANMGADLTAMWVLLGTVAAIALGFFCRLIVISRRSFEPHDEIHPKVVVSDATTGRKMKRLSEKEEVVLFFLKLFKYQLGATERAPGEFQLISRQRYGGAYIYELRVRIKRSWVSRRMTIGRLGEGIGSKSSCFYVIYDDYRVVKLPGSPSQDFNEYIQSIRKERHIADKLTPRACTVPMVSPILKFIHTFPDTAHWAPGQLEERYIGWLARFSNFRKCLQIGDSFAFFMNLSEGYFLSRIIEMLHDVETRTYKEITEQYNTIWDPLEFENRYGQESLSICWELQKIYDECEKAVMTLLVQHALPSSVFPYQIKRWFLIHLAGKEVPSKEIGLTPGFLTEINLLMKKFMTERAETVEAYREAVKKYVNVSSLAMNRPQISAMITNLLFLLGWLKGKGVAIRDLKPDNLFAAAGDPDEYPHFLESPENYEIGLIDLETAVDFGTKRNEDIEQPLLGGTSRFATPSHFFVNDLLAYKFKDIADVFHLQDWYAIIGIIYHIATGEHLFDKTSERMYSISQMVGKASEKKQNMYDVFGRVSRTFWNSAISEFSEKVEEKREILKSLEPIIPENTKLLLDKYVQNEKSSLSAAIRECINAQKIFDSKEDRDYLLDNSSYRIGRLKEYWKSGLNVPEAPPEDRRQIIRLLQFLENVKTQSEQLERILKKFKQPMPTVSLYDMLQFMFRIVLKFMYKEEWGALSGDSMIYPVGTPDHGACKTTLKKKYALYPESLYAKPNK